jgi:ABC-type multidrug transport system fused ATPase/permease subunit
MEDPKQKKSIPIKKLFPYIWEEKFLFFTGLIAMLFISGARLLHPLIIAHIIDVSVPNNDVRDMLIWAGFFVAVVIAMGIVSYFQTVLLAKLGVKIITKIKGEVFEHLLKLPVSYFDKNPVGELIARVEADGERVKQLFSNFSIMLFGNVLFFMGMMAVLFVRNWEITLYLFIPLPLVLAITIVVVRYLRKYYKRIRQIYADVSAILTEYIQGISVVQLFNREERVRKILDEKSYLKRKLESKAAFYEYGMSGTLIFLVETIFIIIIIAVTAPKILNGTESLGTLVVFIQYGNQLFWPLMSISENINFLQRAFVSLNRIYNILDMPTESELRDNNLPSSFQNKIEFQNVWFQYKEDEWVLKDINLTINKGEKIALVGASGSGKTTTISLLCGFYQATKGKIYVDGKNLDSFALKNWRKKTGLVLQDIYLFPGNVLENVRIYNDEIDEKTVETALNTVQAERFLSKSEEGMEMELTERGQNISMGEKQLLSFARAIVFSPEIVIMDEATASVDARTEGKIQKAMESMLEGKTAIIVAHRLTSVMNADKILLFEDGQIIARGTHEELLETSATYKKLFELQFLKTESA